MNQTAGTQESPEQILDGEGLWGGRVLFFPTLPSTNQWAMNRISFCRHGDVIWTLHQTSGLGRANRSWITPAKKALTLSFVLIHLPENHIMPILGQLAALAIQRTLDGLSLDSRLKWPNDILINGKKIAGILSEADMSLHGFILGIGLNVSMRAKDFKSIPLDQPATSLLLEGSRLSLNEVRILLTKNMEKVLGEAWSGGITGLLSRWKDRDWLEGSSVEVRSIDGIFRGVYDGLNMDGRLRLIDGQNRLHLFWSGDVKKVRPRDSS